MSIEHKQDQNLNRLKRSAQVLGEVLATTALLTGGTTIGDATYEHYQEQQKSKAWEQDRAATVEIAKRFTDCHIESLVDTHTPPKNVPRTSNPESRTTLQLEVSLDETEAAKTNRALYSDRNRFSRTPPIVSAAINYEANKLTPPQLGADRGEAYALENYEFIQRTSPEDSYPRTLKVGLYPKTNYPDGKEARIFIEESVSTSDASGRRFMAKGYTDCGTMVFSEKTHSWELLKDSTSVDPVVKQYEDNDGDSMWEPVTIK